MMENHLEWMKKMSHYGVPRLSQLGHSPNLNWDSPRGPVLVPKKLPSWVGITYKDGARHKGSIKERSITPS